MVIMRMRYILHPGHRGPLSPPTYVKHSRVRSEPLWRVRIDSMTNTHPLGSLLRNAGLKRHTSDPHNNLQ